MRGRRRGEAAGRGERRRGSGETRRDWIKSPPLTSSDISNSLAHLLLGSERLRPLRLCLHVSAMGVMRQPRAGGRGGTEIR
eukprot:637387-Hanusia_phi.AAC.1